jgi:HK97 family phage prohead protease
MRQYGIETHTSEFKGSSQYDFRGPSVDLKKLELETHRTQALLAVTVAMIRMPSKKSTWERMAALVREPKIELKTLKEISTQLKVLTAANSGTRAEHRSVLFHGVQTRALAGTNRIVTFIASTDGLDRHGTKVMPMGISTDNYDRNPIILFGHDGYGGFFSTPDPSNIIGKADALRKSEKKLEVDIAFLDAETNPRADMLYRMVKAGAVSTVSIGFIPREVRVEDDGAGNQIPVIVRSELLEISVVPIPSNPEALATGNRSRQRPRPAHSY